MSRLLASIAAAMFLASGTVAHAEAPNRMAVVRVDASQFPDVRVVLQLFDSRGRAATDLGTGELAVYEDGRRQRATSQITSRKAPAAIVLVLDTSGSMAGRALSDAKAAMNILIEGLGADDRAAVLTFSDVVRVAQPLTSDKAALAAATAGAQAAGNTAIFDAVAAGLEALDAAQPDARKAIILLTDGRDTASRGTKAAVSERLANVAYPLYAIGLGADLDSAGLETLAQASREGAFLPAPTSAQLATIYAGLSQLIHTAVEIRYRSDATEADEGDRITLVLQIQEAATVRSSVTTYFTVPMGRGARSPSIAHEIRIPSTSLAVPSGDGGGTAAVVALLGSAAALSFVVSALALSSTYSLGRMTRRRLAAIGADGHSGEVRASRQSTWTRLILPILTRIARLLGRVAPSAVTERTRARIAEAADPFGMGAVEFLGLRVAATLLAGPLLAFVSATMVSDVFGTAMVGVGGSLVGFLIPGLVLDRTAKARRRQIQRSLPSALDLLALSAGAGMTLDGALSQVAQRWSGPLSDEFRRVLLEFRMGRDRRETLRALAARTGVPDVARLTHALTQADSLGVPISRVLQEQAIDMRTRRRQRAEEAARKAPVKMLFPMVLLIFPALFIVILAPAAVQIARLFGQI